MLTLKNTRISIRVYTNAAAAHQLKLARMVYFMLTRGETFVDQGQSRYEDQQRQRSIAALKRRAAALGFQINPTTVVASKSSSFILFLERVVQRIVQCMLKQDELSSLVI